MRANAPAIAARRAVQVPVSSLIGSAHRSARRARRAALDRWFRVACAVVSTTAVLILAVLLISIGYEGYHHLDLSFLTEPPSRFVEQAGAHPAIFGTMWTCLICGMFALPLGVGTAILLEEYKPKHALARRIQALVNLNITNLAGVPSVVYGIIGLTAFVEAWGLFGSTQEPMWELGTPQDSLYFRLPFGRGVLAGGLTLGLVILPIIIVATQEALRAVPNSLRDASLALGASRWQTIARVSLPAALPGTMTGTILAMSRAIGEAAPILVVCGIVYISFTPSNIMDSFTVMPLQIYNWASLPQADFHKLAATGIVVLLSVLLLFNSVAIFIRHRYQKPLQ